MESTHGTAEIGRRKRYKLSMRRGRERKRTREVKNAKGKRAESVKPSLQSSFSLEGFLCLKCRRHGGLMVRVVGRGGGGSTMNLQPSRGEEQYASC